MAHQYFTKTTDPIAEDGTVLEFSVEYRLGTTHSWWDGKPRPRGIVLSITPVRIDKGDGYSSKEFIVGDDRGRSFVLRELRRRSDKQGQVIGERVAQVFDQLAPAAMAQDWAGVANILRKKLVD